MTVDTFSSHLREVRPLTPRGEEFARDLIEKLKAFPAEGASEVALLLEAVLPEPETMS